MFFFGGAGNGVCCGALRGHRQDYVCSREEDDSRKADPDPGAARDKPGMFALNHKHRKRSKGLKWPQYRLGSTTLI